MHWRRSRACNSCFSSSMTGHWGAERRRGCNCPTDDALRFNCASHHFDISKSQAKVLYIVDFACKNIVSVSLVDDSSIAAAPSAMSSSPPASPQARLTLQDAFERFASTVSPVDKRLFNDTKLQDVRDEAIKIERQLRERRTQRNMARLEPFLRGLEHYAKVVEVLCNGTPFLSWIWAPVKLALMVRFSSSTKYT